MRNIYLMLLTFFLCFNLTAQNIVNGSFEEGITSGWTKYSQGGYGLIGTAQFFYSTEITPEVLPLSGQYMARLGGFGYEINSIKQNVTLPNTPKVYLALHYQTRASTTSECAGLWVGAQVRVYVAGQVILDQYLCNYNAVNEWTFGYFDITAAAGQNIEIGFRADAANSVWSYIYFDDISILTSLTDIADNIFVPKVFKLDQNYPNPFNPQTTIQFDIPRKSNVTLEVYNIMGQRVAELVNKSYQPGRYKIDFNASNYASGVYIYRLIADNYIKEQKMILLK